MSLIVETNFANGIPQTAIQGGLQAYGECWHWTAGGTGRAGALASIQHFISTRYTVNASYHILLWVEHTPGHTACKTYAMWIVSPKNASHSVNPANCWKYNDSKDRLTQSMRFDEVRRILGPKANDPNAGMIAISYCGMPTNLAEDVKCAIFVEDCRKLAADLKTIPTMNPRPHFAHGWIQPITRYEADATPNGVDLLIWRLYQEQAPQEAADMIFWRPVQQDWMTNDGTVFYDGDGNKKFFTLPIEKVRSSHESSDGRYRLVKYGTESLIVDARGPAKEGPGLTPIAGTRIPTTGFGFPPPEVKEVPTGISQEDVDRAVDAAADAERERIALAEADRIRNT